MVAMVSLIAMPFLLGYLACSNENFANLAAKLWCTMQIRILLKAHDINYYCLALDITGSISYSSHLLLDRRKDGRVDVGREFGRSVSPIADIKPLNVRHHPFPFLVVDDFNTVQLSSSLPSIPSSHSQLMPSLQRDSLTTCVIFILPLLLLVLLAVFNMATKPSNNNLNGMLSSCLNMLLSFHE